MVGDGNTAYIYVCVDVFGYKAISSPCSNFYINLRRILSKNFIWYEEPHWTKMDLGIKLSESYINDRVVIWKSQNLGKFE